MYAMEKRHSSPPNRENHPRLPRCEGGIDSLPPLQICLQEDSDPGRMSWTAILNKIISNRVKVGSEMLAHTIYFLFFLIDILIYYLYNKHIFLY